MHQWIGLSVQIRCLMPGPCMPGPSTRHVQIAYDLAECQHSIVMLEITGVHAFGIGDGAMVSIVEEEPIAVYSRNEPPAADW